MSLFSRFAQQLQTLLPQQTAFLLALSGGLDSVVLLHLLLQLRRTRSFSLRAIHIHHGLSPNADNWATFCQTLCATHQVALQIERVSVSRDNLEANARAARYHAIRQHRTENEVVLTAHHLDDQVETFFLALKRGSGVQGLGAMAAVGEPHGFPLCRPLLSFDKATLRRYALQHQLEWVEDESNADSDFERNFLRNQALPLLQSRWAQFNEMVARSSRHCAEQQQLLDELLAADLARLADFQQKSLHIGEFQHFSALKQQQLLRLWLGKCGLMMPSSAQLAQLQQLVFAAVDKNPQLQLGEWTIRRYQQQLFITGACPPLAPQAIDLPWAQWLPLPEIDGEIWRDEHEIICKISDKTTRLLLPSALQHAPLQVRFAVQGKVKCYQQPNREEMKKIWQKNSVPPWERTRTPLIFWQDELVAVIAGTAPAPRRPTTTSPIP